VAGCAHYIQESRETRDAVSGQLCWRIIAPFLHLFNYVVNISSHKHGERTKGGEGGSLSFGLVQNTGKWSWGNVDKTTRKL